MSTSIDALIELNQALQRRIVSRLVHIALILRIVSKQKHRKMVRTSNSAFIVLRHLKQRRTTFLKHTAVLRPSPFHWARETDCRLLALLDSLSSGDPPQTGFFNASYWSAVRNQLVTERPGPHRNDVPPPLACYIRWRSLCRHDTDSTAHAPLAGSRISLYRYGGVDKRTLQATSDCGTQRVATCSRSNSSNSGSVPVSTSLSVLHDMECHSFQQHTFDVDGFLTTLQNDSSSAVLVLMPSSRSEALESVRHMFARSVKESLLYWRLYAALCRSCVSLTGTTVGLIL